jgi:hypothetical protein
MRQMDTKKTDGLSPVTLRTQGTIIPSDRSMRFAGKAGIRPVGKAGARVSSLGREGEAGKAEASKTGKAEAEASKTGKAEVGNAGAQRVGWVACLTLEAWLRGGECGENMCKGVGGCVDNLVLPYYSIVYLYSILNLPYMIGLIKL